NCRSSGSVNPNGSVAVTLIGMIVLVPVAPGLLGDSGNSVDWLPLLTTTTGSARAGRPRASAATTTAIDFVCMTTPASFSAWTPAAGGGPVLVLRLQSCARRKHRLSNALQRGLTCHQFPNPRFKRLARHLADLQAEAAQDSPNAQFHVQQPSEKLLARNQQRPDLLRSNRFGVHLLEPSHPQQLGKPTRILAVRLPLHPRQSPLHTPRLHKIFLNPSLRHPGMHPF